MNKDIEQIIDSNYGNRLRIRICAIIVQDNKILLLKHKAKTLSGYLWLPPGGGLEYGERIKDAFSREVLEETNLNVRQGDFYGVTEFLSPPLHALELFYVADNISGQIKLGSDPELSKENQLIEGLKWMSLEDIESLENSSTHEILKDNKKLLRLMKK